MNPNTPPQIKIFYKIGVCMTLLPYLSKNYDEWGDFMWQICYPARLNWWKYELFFLNKYKDCEFDFTEEIEALLKSTEIDSNPKLGPEYALKLMLDKNPTGVHTFLKKAKMLNFKPFGRLELTGSGDFKTQEVKSLCILLPIVEKSVFIADMHLSETNLKAVSGLPYSFTILAQPICGLIRNYLIYFYLF